jgi:hypothetical protein
MLAGENVMVRDSSGSADENIERLNILIERLKTHLPVPEQAEPRLPPMDCPSCRSAMQAGKIRIHGTLDTVLLFGRGFESGWFVPEEGGREEKVLHTNRPRKAYRCPRCQTVVIIGTDPVA